MRLIDADALANYANNQIVGITANDIMRFPTVDAEPVKHAKWYAPASYEPCEWCSNCHERTRWFFDEGYCPKCGARMDGD